MRASTSDKMKIKCRNLKQKSSLNTLIYFLLLLTSVTLKSDTFDKILLSPHMNANSTFCAIIASVMKLIFLSY